MCWAGPLGRRLFDFPRLHLDPLGPVLDAVAAVDDLDQVEGALGFGLLRHRCVSVFR